MRVTAVAKLRREAQGRSSAVEYSAAGAARAAASQHVPDKHLNVDRCCVELLEQRQQRGCSARVATRIAARQPLHVQVKLVDVLLAAPPNEGVPLACIEQQV